MAQKKFWNIAFSGSEDEMRNLLLNRSNVDVNKSKIDEDPLHTAIQHNQDTGVAKALLEHRTIDVNSRDSLWRTPLHIASTKDERWEFVKLLLRHPKILVNAFSRYKMTPLHVAARFACPKVVELLIKDSGVKFDAKTEFGFTALHLVAEGDENPDRDLGSRRPQEDRCKVVQMLLQAQKTRVGCHLNRSDDFKRFPIHYGVECNSVEVVEELLKWDDIDINAQDIHGLTPLHLATRSKADNREAIVKLLLHVENIDINMGSGMPSTNQKPRERRMPSKWNRKFLPFQPMEQEGSTNLTALHFAARLGSLEIVDSLFQEPGIEINIQDDEGCTPLHFAAQAGHVNVVERFLEQDPCLIDLTSQNSNSFTPLDLAIDKGHVAVVRVLLQFTSESDLTRKNSRSGNTTLHIATKSGCVEVTSMLLEHANKLHFNEENMDGDIPFHLDSEEGNVDKVKVVVDHVESYLKEQNKDRNTPLHLAAEEGHVGVVQLLLERCSTLDLEVKNAYGNTLLHQASMNGHDKVVQALLDHAATEFDLDDKNIDGNTPLHLAVKAGHVQVVNVLLGCGLELQLDARNNDFYSPLHFATNGGYLEVVKVLLEHADGEKCGLDSTNWDGNSPLHLAIEEGHVDVVKELLERAGTKLNLNETNDGDNTPLHLAAEAGQVEIVEMLLALDATNQTIHSISTEMNNDQKRTTKLKLNATNKEKNTPLHLACKEGHDEVVDAMLKRVGEIALDAINIRGNTPLHLAAINGHVHTVNKLLELEAKVNLNGRNKKGQTTLHLASIKCYPDVVKALCLAKERLRANLQDRNGKTCLQYAKERQQNRNSKLLKRSKFKFLLERQRKEKFEEITKRLMEHYDVKDFLESQYTERQVFIDAANAYLVGGALIAGITFASWLQPPLGYTTDYQFPQSSLATPPGVFESFAAVELHYSLRLFWVFNTLSFFFAVGTVISGAKVAFPDLDAVFSVVVLRSVRRELEWTSLLLVCSVVTVLGAFVCAGLAVLPPIHKDMRSMKIFAGIGLAICSWTIIKFLIKSNEALAKVLEREQKDEEKETEEETTPSEVDETEEETTPKGYNLCVSLCKSLWVWLQGVCFMRGEGDTDDKMEGEKPQTWLNTKTSSDLLVVTTSRLSQHVKYSKRGHWPEDFERVSGAIQTYHPATWHEQTTYYFEIKIKDNLNTTISMGFTNENFINHSLPGWAPNTYGYHSDGQIWKNGDIHSGNKGVIQGLGVDSEFRYIMGDIVGAGVNYVTGEIFFTKNEKLVHSMPCNLKSTLYPTIGFNGGFQGNESNSNVQVNFKEPYVFDVSHHVQHSNLNTSKKWPLQTKLSFLPFFP